MTTVHTAWKVSALIDRAREYPDYRTTIKKKNDIIEFLRSRGVDLSTPPVVAAPEPGYPVDLKKLKVAELMVLARAVPGFKRGEHGKNKTALLAFLDTGVRPEPHAAQPVVELPSPTELGNLIEGVRNKTIKRPALLALAKERGWDKGNKGKVDELVEFITANWDRIAQPATVPAEPDTIDLSAEQWPPAIHLDTLAGMKVSEIKAILKKFHITEALPTKKADLLRMFEKKRCNRSNLTSCRVDEVCDLRNELCRDDLNARSTRLQEYIFQGRRFWGSPEIIHDIRRAAVQHQENARVVVQQDTGVEETKMNDPPNLPPHNLEQVVIRQEEVGVEPVRVSNLMEDRDAYMRLLEKAIQKTFAVAHGGTHISDPKHGRSRFRMPMEENDEEI